MKNIRLNKIRCKINKLKKVHLSNMPPYTNNGLDKKSLEKILRDDLNNSTWSFYSPDFYLAYKNSNDYIEYAPILLTIEDNGGNNNALIITYPDKNLLNDYNDDNSISLEDFYKDNYEKYSIEHRIEHIAEVEAYSRHIYYEKIVKEMLKLFKDKNLIYMER
jgi:hypothetical protein